MNETILFSPVGGTDPIALVNHRDGFYAAYCKMVQRDKGNTIYVIRGFRKP